VWAEAAKYATEVENVDGDDNKTDRSPSSILWYQQ
jgi:hypothetical protein